ncbi:MAG: hypothetical protein ACOX6F_06435 [Syntrophomonadaceae bacterium]|jgi:hypothetical protein|nr:hypothetical protein [Bacillota bacterium]NLM88093.1 hypothetical protein [Syntrophomonadaceae bacterium]HAA09274.1 hypothetical protein [Syntrophomonas sp.]HQA50240.1 hypothetical protein [Syntrophomonadaceae bacterium]HQD90593.1 hypothetical protein [Syntrophomonadaceae bacterium]
MITIIAYATSQTQAASALTDLRNRGYQAEATLVRPGRTDDYNSASLSSSAINNGQYIVTIRCESDEAGHIKEHLGELHGLDNVEIIPENH